MRNGKPVKTPPIRYFMLMRIRHLPETLVNQINDKLKEKNLTIDELTQTIEYKHQEKIMAVLEWQIDQGKILLNKENQLLLQ